MLRQRPLATRVRHLGLFAVLSIAACAGRTGLGDGQPSSEPPAPRYRSEGARLPAFSGSDPVARGWVRVDDLLWVDQRDAEAYARGQVRDGERFVSTQASLPASVRADRGFLLRTDHVAVRTNVSWDRAKDIARAAEEHLQRVFATLGEPLNLRLPQDPLPVVVIARRAEFEARLRGLVADPLAWGAFYDSQTGQVNVCAEPAARGALPLIADLRHEMTHQILDLSRPPSRRGHPFSVGWFWLWEGVAVWSEHLGDGPGVDHGSMRLMRFERRYAWQQWTPLVDLVALSPRHFEGRHYDQVASFMRYLMDRSRHRAAVLDLLRRLLHGEPTPSLGEALRTPILQVEREWLADRGA